MLDRRVLVIGLGEVGSAFQRVLRCKGRDVLPMHFDEKFHVIIICFGWFDGFEQAVREYAEEHLGEGGVVLVASTVPVGTCDRNGWVHHLTRGRHPELDLSLEEDMHMISGPWTRMMAVAGLLADRGLSVSPVSETAQTTELAKLVELSQFAVEVTMMHEVHALCEQYGVDFHDVYTLASNDYNSLYKKVGEGHLSKPILEYQPGPIGGHCVSPGVRMLGSEWFLGATEGHLS